MNHFVIEDGRDYSFTELLRLISRACSAVADAQKNIGVDQVDLTLSSQDVYFTIFDLIGLASSRVRGEFKLVQPKHGEYRVYYSPESRVRDKVVLDIEKNLITTAISLYEKSGVIPEMTKSKPAVMEALEKHIASKGDSDGKEKT